MEILQCSPVEKWLYFLQHAEHSDAEELSELLGEAVFDEAVGVLKMISQSPEERQYYEARQKFLLDEEARMSGARQEGMEQGLELGRSEGMIAGIEKGTLAGKIQVLQQLLGDKETGTAAALTRMTVEELSIRVQRLQDRLRQRDQT